MRFLVFALIFANLLFFAYSRAYFGAPTRSPDAQRIQEQVHPERIQVLERSGEIVAQAPKAVEVDAAGESPTANPLEASEAIATTASEGPRNSPPDAPLPPPGAPKENFEETTICALFSTPQAETAEQLAERALAAGLAVNWRNEGSGGWWVFIPPQADRSEAVKKAGELRALGISEFFIVNEGPQQFAISLGVFSREEAARSYLAQLRGKGVRSAQIGPRNADKGRPQLEVRGEIIAVIAFRANSPEGVTSKDCP
jgi:hypothetical protein